LWIVVDDWQRALCEDALVGRVSEWRYRNQLKKRYRMRLDPVAFTLGLQMRNQVAAHLLSSEKIVEDDLIIVAERGRGRDSLGERSLGWLVLTSKRVFWSALPGRKVEEVPLSSLRLEFSEDDWDTYAWGEGRRAAAVSLGFMMNSPVREMLRSGASNAATEL
jgi:hypothetical protein